MANNGQIRLAHDTGSGRVNKAMIHPENINKLNAFTFILLLYLALNCL